MEEWLAHRRGGCRVVCELSWRRYFRGPPTQAVRVATAL